MHTFSYITEPPITFKYNNQQLKNALKNEIPKFMGHGGKITLANRIMTLLHPLHSLQKYGPLVPLLVYKTRLIY